VETQPRPAPVAAVVESAPLNAGSERAPQERAVVVNLRN